MKNKKYELFGRLQKQYHRNHPWRLSRGGLYIPHAYHEMAQDGLSWWDDVGFILNGRRVIVWWRHPRKLYEDAIDEQAWQEAGPGPERDWPLTAGATKNYRKAGASRKKLVSYTMPEQSEERTQYYGLLQTIGQRLATEGIDLEVAPTWRTERLKWATGVSLVAPLEVRNESELADVAALARRLVLHSTSLEAEFPNYRYSREDWLKEVHARPSPQKDYGHQMA